MTETRETPLNSLHQWVIEHDDRWLFIVLYISLAVVLSIWISLFWLVVVVGVHFLFELLRQRHLHRRPGATLIQALWEIKLDIGLVLFALVLALYMELVLGVLGLQSAARIGAVARASSRGARFAGWERALRGILLSVDDAAQVARAFARNNSNVQEGETLPELPPIRTVAHARWGSWAGQWSTGDRIAAGLIIICLALILLAPLLTDHSPGSALATLAEELQPFPTAGE
jgi:hypothetical protein